MKQRTYFFSPRERQYLKAPWLLNEAIMDISRNERKIQKESKGKDPKDETIEPLTMGSDSLVNEGNIREVKKLVKKKANEEMAPFLVGHMKEWENLAREAEAIGGIEKQRLMDELGENARIFAAFIRDWFPPKAKEQLLIELLSYGGEGDAPPIDPRSVLKGFTAFFESRRLDSDELDAAREDTLRHVGVLAEGIKDWTPYTRRGWERGNGEIVFPEKFADGVVPSNIYLVKNAHPGIREVKRWLSGQQDFVLRGSEIIAARSRSTLSIVCTVRLPEMIMAILSGRGESPVSRPYLKRGMQITDKMMDEWREAEPKFYSMSIDDIFRSMVHLMKMMDQVDLGGGKVYTLKIIPIRFRRSIQKFWPEQPNSLFMKCIDTMKQMDIVKLAPEGDLRLTKLGKELCRLDQPQWLKRHPHEQRRQDVA